MQYNRLEIKPIKLLSELDELSHINKRVDASVKIQKFIAGKLEPEFKHIDWSKANLDYDYLPWAEKKGYIELWKQRHEMNLYYQDHDLKEYPIALEYTVSYDRRQTIAAKDWLSLQIQFFRQEFQEENILSMMFHYQSEKNPHCHILIYPINSEGKIDASAWVQEDMVSVEQQNRYLKFMEEHHLSEQEILTDIANHNLHQHRTIDDTIPFLNTIETYHPEELRTIADDQELIYDAKSMREITNSKLTMEQQDRILNDLLHYFTKIEKRKITQARLGQIPKAQFEREVIAYLKTQEHLKDAEEINIMLSRVNEAIYGYYVIEDLINDDSISDIKILAPDKIRIKRFGKRLTSNAHFFDAEDYYRFLEGVAIKNHTSLDPFNAVQNFTDKTTNQNFILRFNICTNYVNSTNFPYLHIRKIAKNKYSLEDLLHYQMMDMKTASYLLDKVKTASGILFTGKGASGKTTLMNVLLEHIPYSKSGLVIQENEELFSVRHPDLMFQHIVTARKQGAVEFGLKDLARNGLLTDLDYFIIGEIKGDEALYFLNAAYTGHQCWASVHGSSSTEAMNKLADYVKYASDYAKEDILKMLLTMQVIVFMKDFKVYEISEVDHWDEEKKEIVYRPIYQYVE